MIEHVFSMEENTRKYRLLKKDTYREKLKLNGKSYDLLKKNDCLKARNQFDQWLLYGISGSQICN